MERRVLYKFKREDGGTTVSPVKPAGSYKKMYRLIADEGRAITDGKRIVTVADVDSYAGWKNCDLPEEEKIPESDMPPEEGGVDG